MLSVVDLHDELAACVSDGKSSFAFEVNIFDRMLRELGNCDMFIGLLDDCYGPPLGATLCAALSQRGHEWIEDEGLMNASMEEILVRKALRSESILLEACRFNLLRKEGDAPNTYAASLPETALQDAACAPDALRAGWRADIARESEARGCLGALEELVSRYSVSVSPDVGSLALGIFAGRALGLGSVYRCLPKI